MQDCRRAWHSHHLALLDDVVVQDSRAEARHPGEAKVRARPRLRELRRSAANRLYTRHSSSRGNSAGMTVESLAHVLEFEGHASRLTLVLLTGVKNST